MRFVVLPQFLSLTSHTLRNVSACGLCFCHHILSLTSYTFILP